MTTLTLSVPDAEALRAIYERDLSKARAFVPAAVGVQPLEPCELVLECCGRTHVLRAEAVFVKVEGVGCGVGLQLAALEGAALGALREFVEGALAAPDEVMEAEPVTAGAEDPSWTSLHERIRKMSLTEQQRLALGGSLTERVAVERAFGANVWETLLSSPRLTVPEVARIARKGTLSRPLVESIAARAAWLAAPEVQRALLSNPRSTPAVVTKVLLAMSRSDLTLVPQQTGYPQGVRAAAKRMLGK